MREVYPKRIKESLFEIVYIDPETSKWKTSEGISGNRRNFEEVSRTWVFIRHEATVFLLQCLRDNNWNDWKENRLISMATGIEVDNLISLTNPQRR